METMEAKTSFAPSNITSSSDTVVTIVLHQPAKKTHADSPVRQVPGAVTGTFIVHTSAERAASSSDFCKPGVPGSASARPATGRIVRWEGWKAERCVR
jgi:hypothetical protein